MKIAKAFIVIYAFCFLFSPNILAQEVTRDNYYKAVDNLNYKTVEFSLGFSDVADALTKFQGKCNCRDNPNSNKIKESIDPSEKEALLITDEIDKLKTTAVPSDIKTAIDFLSSDIFSNKEKFPVLTDFATKYSIQRKDKNGVFIVPINKLKDQLKKETSAIFSMEQQNVNGSNDTSERSGFFSYASFTYGLYILIPIVAIIFAVFVYLDLNKRVRKLEEINKWKPKTQPVTQPVTQPLAISKTDIELESRLKIALNNELDSRLKNALAKFESRLTDLENPRTEKRQSENLNSRDPISETPKNREDKKNHEEIFYFPMPNDDKAFSVNSAQSTFKEGESIYKFKKISTTQAKFKIDDRDSSILIALRYPEAVIEPACDAQNSRADSEKRIVTIEYGTAVLDGNVWKVVKKAVIRYEH